MQVAWILPGGLALGGSQQRLRDAVAARDHEIMIWPVEELQWGANDAGLVFTLRGEPLPRADVIHWWLPYGAKAGQALVEAMAVAGLPMFPSPFIPFSDKVTQARRLGVAGIRIPQTTIVTAADLVARAGEFSWPRVVKKPEGSQGKGVFWAEQAEDVANLLDKEGLRGGDLVVVQEVIRPLGEDVRAFMVDGDVVAAMVRRAEAGEFRANVALGGVGTMTTLTTEEARVVLDAWVAMGRAPWAGVDFIRSIRGPVVLEVNLWPGFVGLEDATGLDIATLLAVSLERFAAQR